MCIHTWSKKKIKIGEIFKMEIVEQYQDPENGETSLSTNINSEKQDGIYLSVKLWVVSPKILGLMVVTQCQQSGNQESKQKKVQVPKNYFWGFGFMAQKF